MNANGPKIYLAAPLFSPAERERNARLRDSISSIGNVYLPQEDGGLVFDLVRTGTPLGDAKQKIFDWDIRAISECDILIIVMDGRSIDEGACFELGYAFAIGKTCVGLKTDARSLFIFGDNPMIECALRRIFANELELIEWLQDWGQTN